MKRIIALPLRMLRRLPWDNRGAIAIISGLVIVPVLLFAALVVDVGRMYYVRRNLQNIADATCLACAYGYGLTEDKVQAVANANANADEALVKNGFDPANAVITVLVPPGDVDYRSDQYPRVRVVVKQNTGLYFARIINHMSQDISARAVCELGSWAGGIGVMPWGAHYTDEANPDNSTHGTCSAGGVPCTCGKNPSCPIGSALQPGAYAGFQFGYEYKLKFGPHEPLIPGNFGALDVPPDTYQQNVENGGTKGPVYLCQCVETKGGVVEATDNGLCTLLGGTKHGKNCVGVDPHDQIGAKDIIKTPIGKCLYYLDAAGVYQTVPNSCSTSGTDEWRIAPHAGGEKCPRLVIVPIVEAYTEQGKTSVLVIGFSRFFITRWETDKDKQAISGYFIDDSILAGGSWAGYNESFGSKVIRLVK